MNRQQQSGIALSSVLALLCLWIVPAYAQKVTVTPGKKITLEVSEAEFLPTVKLIFKQAGVRYRIMPAAEAIAKGVRVTLTTEVVPLQSVIKELLLVGGMTYKITCRQENGVYVLKPGSELVIHPKTAPQKVSLVLKDATLETALIQVLVQAKVSYVFSLEGCVTQKITLTLNEVPHKKAIAMLLEAARPKPVLKFEAIREERSAANAGREIVCIYPDEPMMFQGNFAERFQRTLTLHLQNEHLYFALDAVFRMLRADFTLEPLLRDIMTAPLSLRNVSIQTTMNRLLDPWEGLFRPTMENDVLAIVPTFGVQRGW